MGKKKNLKGLEEFEIDFINEKLEGNRVSDYIDPDGLINVRGLKALNYKLNIKCKNQKQKEFLENLKDKNHQICFGVGSPGTGKSFLSSGGADLSLGFLKGDFFEKTRMFTEADKETINKILKLSGNISYQEITNTLINSNIIKYEYVNFLLGKTIDNSIILVNESEQYTKDNMRLILTRLGENSKIIITGDSKQVNRKSIKNKNDVSGLDYSIEKLSEMEEVSITEFTDEDIVRNGLITKILQHWD